MTISTISASLRCAQREQLCLFPIEPALEGQRTREAEKRGQEMGMMREGVEDVRRSMSIGGDVVALP